VNGPGTVILIGRSVFRAQELHIAHRDRTQPPNAPDDPRHERRLAGAADDGARIIEVDTFERGRKPVEVALAPHLAVRHDIDAGALLIANGNQCGIVLCLLERLGSDPPQLAHPDPRRRIRGEHRPVNQPVRLRIRADERCRKQFCLHRCCGPVGQVSQTKVRGHPGCAAPASTRCAISRNSSRVTSPRLAILRSFTRRSISPTASSPAPETPSCSRAHVIEALPLFFPRTTSPERPVSAGWVPTWQAVSSTPGQRRCRIHA